MSARDLVLKLEDALRDAPLPEAVSAARTFVEILERRLLAQTEPLDLLFLPGDLPTLDEVRRQLARRAIASCSTIEEAARRIGVGRSTLFKWYREGLDDEDSSTCSPAR